MNEKIIEILTKNTKSMDATEIMNEIDSNYKVEELTNLLECLKKLCEEGTIYQRNDNKYMLFEKSNFKKGIIEITSKGFGFVLNDPEDLYVPMSNLCGASDKDFVIVEVSKNKGIKREYRVVRILKRGIDNSLGEIYEEKGIFKIKSLKQKDIKLNLIYNNEQIVDGSIVKFEIVNEVKKKELDVKINKIVGHKNSPDIDTLKIVEEFDIIHDFNEDTLKEAESMPSNIDKENKDGRIDLTNKIIFTIDGSDTKDIDDAISLEMLDNGNYLLGVHIADVSYYVKEDSALKKAAFERGNSVYLADRVIPMLPVALSNGICSLNEKVDRFTTSCEMEINNKGEVVKYNIFKGIINSKKKMNYESVNKIFKGEELKDYKTLPYTITKDDTIDLIAFKYGMTIDELKNLNKESSFKEGETINIDSINILKRMLSLSKILRSYKEKRGAIEFLSSEVKLKVDENGKVLDISKRTDGLGENLIEDFMIAANETVATHIYNMNLPFVYRIHANPSPEKIKEFINFISVLGHKVNGKMHYENMRPTEVQNLLNGLKDSKDYEVFNKKLLRCMAKAVYDSENIGHFGLGSPCYTHFTSPIRRYSDLMVHYFLNEYLFKSNMNQDFCNGWNQKLSFICEHISKTERAAEDCEYAVNDMKIAEYMESHIGEIYDAKIDGCLNNGFFVETDNLISGLVSLDTYPEYLTYKEELMSYTGKKNRIIFRLGDKVKVKCIAASKEERKVDFMIVRDEDGNIK